MLHFCEVKLYFLSVLGFLICHSLYGQSDTIPQKPIVKPLSNFIFQFDNRREDYYGEKGRMNGLKIGAEFYKRLRSGFAFYSNSRFYPFNAPNIPEGFSQTVSISYSTFWMEFVPMRGFRYEVSFPIGIGGGNAEINRFQNSNTGPTFIGKDTVSGIKILDIGINAHFKPIPYIGLGIGAGYRMNTNNVPNFNAPITNTYIDFKLKLFVGYVFKKFYKPELIEQEKAYYKYKHDQLWNKIRTKLQ